MEILVKFFCDCEKGYIEETVDPDFEPVAQSDLPTYQMSTRIVMCQECSKTYEVEVIGYPNGKMIAWVDDVDDIEYEVLPDQNAESQGKFKINRGAFKNRKYRKMEIAEQKNQVLQELQTLKNQVIKLGIHIELGEIDLTTINAKKYREWAGAGLIVTSDMNRQSTSSEDIVIRFPNAHIAVWLTYELRDICALTIGHFSKYEFYGKIGECLAQYFKHNVDGNVGADGAVINSKKLCVVVMNDVCDLFDEWMQRVIESKRKGW